jgi:hypothetical protein
MSLFNWQKKENRRFPAETDDGRVMVENNIVKYNGRNPIDECGEVPLDEVHYAHGMVNNDGDSFLTLSDRKNRHFQIPSKYSGFQTVYNEVSLKLGFSDNFFSRYLNARIKVKKLLWRKNRPGTYEILDGTYEDFAQGFVIQSPELEVFGWDTTYTSLKSNPHFTIDESFSGNEIARCRYPVRIGNIILKEFWINLRTERPDAPVSYYYVECFDTTNTDKSYREIKERLLMDFPKDCRLGGYERNDQNYVAFNLSGIRIELCYTYDSEWQFDQGCTSLSVRNEREYPELLSDDDYEKRLVVSEFVSLPESVSIAGHWRYDKRIKRRPPNLSHYSADGPVIWVDKENSKIGFADSQFSKVYELGEIERLTIFNTLPAKGGGRARLTLTLAENKGEEEVFVAECRGFDSHKDDIAALTGLEVTYGPEDHDC